MSKYSLYDSNSSDVSLAQLGGPEIKKAVSRMHENASIQLCKALRK